MKVKNCCLLFLTLAAFVSCNPAEDAKSTVDESRRPCKIIFLGDGITAGSGLAAADLYTHLLSTKLAAAGEQVKIVNAGITGETIAGVNERIAWMLQQRFDGFFLLLGSEDQRSGHAIAAQVANWEAVLEKIHRANPEAYVAIGMPGRTSARADLTFLAPLAKRMKVNYIDFPIADTDIIRSAAMQDAISQQLLPFVQTCIERYEE